MNTDKNLEHVGEKRSGCDFSDSSLTILNK